MARTTFNATNFHKASTVSFTHIYAGELYTSGTRSVVIDSPEKLWSDLMELYADKIVSSPISDSKYIVLEDKVYRISDHWGRCASCVWNLKFDPNVSYPDSFKFSSLAIGVAFYNDFKTQD